MSFLDALTAAAGGWRRRVAASSALAAALFAAGCTSDRGVAEFAVYESTYAGTAATLTVVLDEFEAVERARSVALIRATGVSPVEPREDRSEAIALNGGFDETFHIADAVYFAPAQVPPATAAFRRALASITAFNAVAGAYADGRAAREVADRLLALAGTVEALAQAVRPEAAVLGLALPGNPVAATAEGVLARALAAGSREAFREAILALHPAIKATLAEFRAAAPRLFSLLTATARDAAKEAHFAGRIAERDAAIAVIENYRAVLSNWVVAIDATDVALEKLVAAIRGEGARSDLLGDLALTVEQAAGLATETRRLLGEIRTRR